MTLVELAGAGAEGEIRIDTLRLERGPPAAPPSILFISIDTLAADHMSLYGYPRPTTPYLEKLAGESVVFDRCLANASATTPSYVSQFTGLVPGSCWTAPRWDPEKRAADGDRHPGYSIPSPRWTLAEMLRAAGYRTAAFIDNPNAGARFGIDQGFERFDDSAARITSFDPEGGIRHIVPRAEEWLAMLDPREPFFLFINALDVHSPYVPPEEFRGRFGNDDLYDERHELAVGRSAHLFGCIPLYVARSVIPEGDLPPRMRTKPLIDLYDDQIAAVDDAVRGFLERLRERGTLDRTVVIFTADHGETMLESDRHFGHGVNHESVLHVPLLVRRPGSTPTAGRVTQTVQLIDLLPTIAELAGIGFGRDYLHGRSLLPLLRGERMDPLPVLSEGGYLETVAVSDGEWRLVETHPTHATNEIMLSSAPARAWLTERFPELKGLVPGANDLSGLSVDPAAAVGILPRMRRDLAGPRYALHRLREGREDETDLAARVPERLAAMRALLDRLRRRGARARALVSPEEVDPAWTPAELEELRKLGYVDEGR